MKSASSTSVQKKHVSGGMSKIERKWVSRNSLWRDKRLWKVTYAKKVTCLFVQTSAMGTGYFIMVSRTETTCVLVNNTVLSTGNNVS